jgi:hypothetical protein
MVPDGQTANRGRHTGYRTLAKVWHPRNADLRIHSDDAAVA